SFTIMAVIFNGFETSSESAVNSGERDNASLEQYLEGKRHVQQFLHSHLSPQQLQYHQRNVELLKKCYFYLEIEPKHMNMRDRNHVTLRTDIFQLVDSYQFQRMKKVGKTQTEIQLTLLTELLEQLLQGREELSCYVETYDMITFLSQWDLIMQRLSKLSEFAETFLSLQVPGKLYIKHHLVSHADLRGSRLPNITLSLRAKMPLIFDRNESFAHQNWAKLKWFTENQESHLEHCDLYIKLLTNRSQAEMGHSRIQEVASNTCVVQNLLPDRSYEFTIRRSDTPTLVFGRWHDSITLTTKTDAVEDADSSA
ncbi:Uncharacterized protein C20orf195, partial [Chlamydotis macqueenii]